MTATFHTFSGARYFAATPPAAPVLTLVRYPPSNRKAAGSPFSESKTITMPSLAGRPSSTFRGNPEATFTA